MNVNLIKINDNLDLIFLSIRLVYMPQEKK